MTSKWLLIFSVLIYVICWSESYHDYEYIEEPIWFRIKTLWSDLVLDVEGKVPCPGSKIIVMPTNRNKDTQLWRWYKGMLINKKTGLVIDAKDGLNDGSELMLNYGHHLSTQCWTVFVNSSYAPAHGVESELENCQSPNRKISIGHVVGMAPRVWRAGTPIQIVYPPARW